MLRTVAVAAIGVLFAGTAEAGVWTRVAVSPTVEVAYDKGFVNLDHDNRYISVIWVQRTTQAADQGGDYRVSREYVDCATHRLRTTRSATYVFGSASPVDALPEQSEARAAPQGSADQLLAAEVCGPPKALTRDDMSADDDVFARTARAAWPTSGGGSAPAARPAGKPAAGAATASAQPDPNEAPTYGAAVVPGDRIHVFDPVALRAGGDIDAARVSRTCSGFVSRAPDYRIDYTAGRYSLVVISESPIDTTLVIRDPDGTWRCDDDTRGDGNAQVTFSKPRSGTYDIWVGSYGGASGPANLLIRSGTLGEALGG